MPTFIYHITHRRNLESIIAQQGLCCDHQMAEQVQAVLATAEHQPRVVIRPGWYY